MNLALAGVLTIAALLALILTRKASPLVALILVPCAAALATGAGLKTGTYVVQGIGSVAPMAAMFVFAIAFFGVVGDAGMFDPLIRGLLRLVGTSPVRIMIGTAALAFLAHLDGNGAVTFLITVPTMLPVFERLGMDRRKLAGITGLAAGVSFLPWTGPTVRAAAALKLTTHEIFVPLLPAQVVGIVFTFAVAWWWGRQETKRLNVTSTSTGGSPAVAVKPLTPEQQALRRPRLVPVNLLLALAVMGSMIVTTVPPAVSFMIGLSLALVVNYPNVEMQKQRIDAHARAALMMASVLFAAGAFTGIMQGAGMLSAMATAAAGAIPPSAASHIPVGLGLVSMPLSLVFDPDSFYFGVLPVVANAAHLLGVPTVEVAQAALLGQMTTGFSVSPLTPATFLLVGLAGIDLADHQKYSIPVLWAASALMTVAAALFGIIRW
jgi:citrate-Mg2+:H+ or citrate-Ca2+:H+ symporter, CitMHS family